MNHAMGSKNQILKKKDRCLITESSFQPQELSLLTTALDINDVCSLYIMTDLIRIFVFSCIMGLIILTTLWPIIFQLSLFSFSHTVFILLLHHNAQCVCMHACMCVYEREGELFFWVWLIFAYMMIYNNFPHSPSCKQHNFILLISWCVYALLPLFFHRL